MLLFFIGGKRYACSCELLVEVIPALALLPVIKPFAVIVGMLPYRQRLIPVLDFAKMCTGHPCIKQFGSRILVAKQQEPTESLEWMGVLVERATSMIALTPEDFVTSSPSGSESYLKGVYLDEEGTIDYVDLIALFEKAEADMADEQGGRDGV